MRITTGALVRSRRTGAVGQVRRIRGGRARVAWTSGRAAEDVPLADLEPLTAP
jgi:hypothetical protein